MSAVLNVREPSAKYLSALELPLIRNFELLASAPEGVERLRILVHSLAMRGQLVAQSRSDEPAASLLIHVAAEKKRLVASGVIKKESFLSGVAETEAPFALPQTWQWSRLGTVATRVQYGFTASASHGRDGPRLVRITDIQDGKVEWSSVPGVDATPSELAAYLLEVGDLLIARTGGTIGKSFLLRSIDVPAVFASYLIRVSPAKGICPAFMKVFAGSDLYWNQLHAASMGTGQPNVNGTSLSKLSVPIPPLAEQHRIVARVEELMKLCDALEARGRLADEQHARLTSTLFDALAASESVHALAENWQRISDHFDLLLDRPEAIDALEQTIFQLAVQGLLVPQLADDGTACSLSQRIDIKKTRGGKDRKSDEVDRNVPSITAEKIFAIPKTWTWDTITRVTAKVTDGEHLSPKKTVAGMMLLTAKHVTDKGLKLDDPQFVSLEDGVLSRRRCDPEQGDILICSRGTIGRTCIVDTTLTFCLMGSVILIKPGLQIDSQYLHLYLSTTRAQKLMKGMSFATAVSALYLKDIKTCPVPIPPLCEQHRIVARVEELRCLCAQLRERLTSARRTQSQLAEALVAEVA